MFIRSKKPSPDLDESLARANGKLVKDVFGRDEDVNSVMPKPEKIIVLLWIYREDEEVVQYLCQLIENHVMKTPKLVDTFELYLPQLIQLALQWEPLTTRSHGSESLNTIESLLLVMAQLSTRFAVQYHWTIQNLLEDLEPECSYKGRANDKFDMEYYARCMILSGDLERCMRGAKREVPRIPRLEIAMSYGGRVTNGETHSVVTTEENNKTFFSTISEVANDNACEGQGAGESQSVATLDVPLKKKFGGVLLFEREQKGLVRRNPWKERYFAVEEGMLNCYSRERKLLRSMSLEGATIWKGPQRDKYPHSFIVANNTTMFHLQASSEEQKSAWKYNLRKVIKASALPEDLAESQKERYERYQNAKWFGRKLTEVMTELDNTLSSERSQALQDLFYELEIPQNMIWPWKTSGESLDKHIFVVLPHFSHLASKNEKKCNKNQPNFQASFMLKQNETAVPSSYDTFIQEGRQKNVSISLPLPDTIRDALEAASSSCEFTPFKHDETGSVTGASTDDVSVADSNVSGYIDTASEPDEANDDGDVGKKKDAVANGDSEMNSEDTLFEIPITKEEIPMNRYISELTVDLPDDFDFRRGTNQSFKRADTIGKEDTIEEGDEFEEEEEVEEKEGTQEVDDHLPNLSIELVLKGAPIPEQSSACGNRIDGSDKSKASMPRDGHKSSDSSSGEADSDDTFSGPKQNGETHSKPSSEQALRHDALSRSNRSNSFFGKKEDECSHRSSTSKEWVSLVTKPYLLEEIIAIQLVQYYESFFAPSMIWVRAPRVRRVDKDMIIKEVHKQNIITAADAKANAEKGGNLLDYYVETYGTPDSESFQRAQTCFAQSLAGHFLMSYLLGIKNRHDSNLLLDKEGHIFTSDYSCVLGSDAPGLGSSMEIAPFKLTTDYLNIMGGPKGTCYQFFRCLVVSGLKRAREDAATAVAMLKMVPGSQQSHKKIDSAARFLQQKLMLGTTDEAAERKMRLVIEQSQQHLSTSVFDAISKTRQTIAVGVQS